MPQPTPQYGQVVSTSRAIGAACSFGRSAPVGQVATHWPHEVQMDDDISPSPTTPTRISWPRPRREMAPMCCTSAQAVVHRPHRMHASRSRTKKLLESSTAKWCCGWWAGALSACCLAAAPTCPKPSRSGAVVSMDQVRSRTALRVLTASGCWVSTTSPSRAGRWQAALALDVDEAGAAGAERGAIGILAELGQGDAEAVHGVQHRGARGNLDLRAVDDDAKAHGMIQIPAARTF